MANLLSLEEQGRAKSDREAKRSRLKSAAAAEIAPMPGVGDPELKEACRYDLNLFLTSYFPESTGLSPFSKDHEDFIARLEASIHEGGRQLDAVYRGFAKTTIGENTCLWASLYGHVELVPLLGFDKAAAESNLDSIKLELSSNELLMRDFPEVCYPIYKLDGKWQRCRSQTYNHTLTNIQWTVDELVLPTVYQSPASGVAIRAKGFLKCPRGMKHKMPDGRNVRPRWVFIDDPQDDESARSPEQCSKRIDKLYKTILKLGGHTSQLSVFIAATCIEPQCFISQLMNKDIHTSFASYRVPMVKQWSKAHDTLWEDYRKLRQQFDRSDLAGRSKARKAALEYYQAHRDIMDMGCEVSWSECYSRDEEAFEISAIQHAYNMLIDDGEDVFECECQNNPQIKETGVDMIDATQLALKVSGFERYTVPTEATHVTAFIDVQAKALYYSVMAWTQNLKGYVIDYGVFPGQGTRRFNLRTLSKTLRRKYPGSDQSGAIFNGLQEFVPKILDTEFFRLDKTFLKCNCLLIDANWGEETETVKNFVEQFSSPVVLPSHGRAINVDALPIVHWNAKPGEYKGDNWIVHRPEKRTTKSITFDANYYKTMVMQGWVNPRESKGSVQLYKASPTHHRQFAEHHFIEVPEQKVGKRRTIVEWTVPKHLKHSDNHWADCTVGNFVAASLCGLSSESKVRQKPPKKRRKKVRQ